MNRSYSKIRHIQEANQMLEKRILNEQKLPDHNQCFNYQLKKGINWTNDGGSSDQHWQGFENGVEIEASDFKGGYHIWIFKQNPNKSFTFSPLPKPLSTNIINSAKSFGGSVITNQEYVEPNQLGFYFPDKLCLKFADFYSKVVEIITTQMKTRKSR